MRDGASFVEQARGATMDLAGDDGIVDRVQRASQITWDRKNKKFVKGEGIGADNKKLLRTESGARLPATYKSGRFDEWKTKNKRALPRTGEAEPENISRGGADTDGRRFRHNKITAPKALDKTLTSYERRVRKIKGAERAAAEETDTASGKGKGNRGGRGAPGAGVPSARGGKGGNSVAAVKNEIRSVDQIRKKRADLAKVRCRFISSSDLSMGLTRCLCSLITAQGEECAAEQGRRKGQGSQVEGGCGFSRLLRSDISMEEVQA